MLIACSTEICRRANSKQVLILCDATTTVLVKCCIVHMSHQVSISTLYFKWMPQQLMAAIKVQEYAKLDLCISTQATVPAYSTPSHLSVLISPTL